MKRKKLVKLRKTSFMGLKSVKFRPIYRTVNRKGVTLTYVTYRKIGKHRVKFESNNLKEAKEMAAKI